MNILTLKEINQFLPQDKLEVTSEHYDTSEGLDDLELTPLEASSIGTVRAKLADHYDVSNWGSSSDVPNLIITIIGMLVAGRIYSRQFAEEVSTPGSSGSYGEKLIAEAYNMLDGIAEGTLFLDDAQENINPIHQPSILETEPMFSMGEAF